VSAWTETHCHNVRKPQNVTSRDKKWDQHDLLTRIRRKSAPYSYRPKMKSLQPFDPAKVSDTDFILRKSARSIVRGRLDFAIFFSFMY
jgi:hypothetical protein